MKVLLLVTERRPFFDDQVAALDALGIGTTVREVPGTYRPDDPRGPAEYARFYPEVAAALGDHDVVHAHYGLTAPFALALPRRPVVVTLWGTDLMGERGWVRRLSRVAARRADAAVLPSRRMAPALDAPYTLVPFGVDTERFRPMPRAEAREQVGWDADETVVLFPYAPERPEKDCPRAERVVERADTDATLRTVTGVPHDEMPHYLNASDALLVTSRRESGPMVVKEAAACGLPVVSTDVGFVGEVPGTAVRDTTDGLAAALDEALGGSRPDPVELPDEWRVEATARRLRSVYERVLDDRRASRSEASAGATRPAGVAVDRGGDD